MCRGVKSIVISYSGRSIDNRVKKASVEDEVSTSAFYSNVKSLVSKLLSVKVMKGGNQCHYGPKLRSHHRGL